MSDGFGVVHRKQASGTTSPSGCRTRWVGWSRPRSTCCAASPRTRRAPSSSSSAVEGVRQARRHRQPARQGRPAADRWRHGLHLPQGAGPRGRQEPARGRPGRHLPRLPRAGRPRRVEILLPTDVAVDTEFPLRPGAPAPGRSPRGRIPADAMAASTSGRSPARVRRGPRRRARTVFWNGPMGFETPAFADGTRGRRGVDPDRRVSPSSGRRLGAAVRTLGSTSRRSVTSRPVAARAWSTSRARRPGIAGPGGDGSH